MNFDVIYARVSTDEQAKDGKTSIDEQIAACKPYLERLDLTNWLVFKEDFSGFEEDRPELDKIKELIKAGKVRSFTALRVDRLCRKSGILERIRDGYFKPYGVQVHTVQDLGQWLWNPNHETLQESLAVFASNWGKMAVEVMQKGRKAHVKAGNVITCGRPPLGFNEVVQRDSYGKRKGAILEPNKQEARIVLRAYEYLVSDGVSVNSIARLFNEDGVPTFTQLRGDTPFRAKQQKNSKSRHQWRGATVRQMLVNPVYDGRWQFGRNKTIKTVENGKVIKKRVRDDSQAITVEVPRLVPHDVWQDAQEILSRNKKAKAGAPIKYDYLLRKRVTCKCSYKCNCHAKKGGQYLYYVCSAKKRGADCDIVSFNAKDVDAIAWQWLYDLLSNKDKLQTKLDNYIQEQERIARPLLERAELIDSLIQKKEGELEKMLSSFHLLSEALQARMVPQMEQLEGQIAEHKREREAVETGLRKYREVLKMFNEYQDKNPWSIKYIPSEDGAINKAQLGYMFASIFNDTIEPKTFEEKLARVEKFDLRVTVISKDEILVQCKLDSEILGLNCIIDRHRV